MHNASLFTDESGDPSSTIRRHDGHQLIGTVDKSQLPVTAVLRCQTCGEELSRTPLDIRVISLGSMCFGDGQDNWHNELFIGGWAIPVASLYGDDPLLKRIDREIGSLDARTDMSTVTMGSRIVEPARIVEPVSNSFPNPERYEEERIRFEALWAATSDPERTYLALQALPLAERIAQLQHDLHHDQSIGGEEDLAYEAGIRLNQALEDLHALFHPAQAPQPETPLTPESDDWWLNPDENPTKTAAAPS